MQSIQLSFVLGRIHKNPTYQKQFIRKFIQNQRCSNVKLFQLSIYLGHNRVIDYRNLTNVEVIQTIDDAVYKHLRHVKYDPEDDPTDIMFIDIEPLLFEPTIPKRLTQMDVLTTRINIIH